MKKILFIGLISLFTSISAYAGVCNNKSVKGNYSVEYEGLLDANWYPVAVAGRVTFDGLGSYTFSYTQTTGGAVGSYVDSGTYTVTSDCTLSTNGTDLDTKVYLTLLVENAKGVNVANAGVAVGWDATNLMSFRGSMSKTGT